jgi:hypothetical protein
VLRFDTAMLLVVPPDVASELQELVQVGGRITGGEV